jgi:hypothetical protein
VSVVPVESSRSIRDRNEAIYFVRREGAEGGFDIKVLVELPRSSRGLYPSPCATAAAAAAAELYLGLAAGRSRLGRVYVGGVVPFAAFSRPTRPLDPKYCDPPGPVPPTATSVPSTSMYLPPPPGPPGTYLRFFKGGSLVPSASALCEFGRLLTLRDRRERVPTAFRFAGDTGAITKHFQYCEAREWGVEFVSLPVEVI